MRLIRDGEKGARGYGEGERGILYTYRCHHQNNSCIKMGSDERNKGQGHKTVSTEHNFWRERRAEADSNSGPSAYQPNALPLGQTGSSYDWWLMIACNSAILRSQADSLRSHVTLYEWLAFYSVFLNIHRSCVLTALAWLVPNETAVYTIQSYTMSFHAKPHT